MDNKIKYWVLLAIKEFSKKDGVRVGKLIEELPEFIPEDNIWEFLREMEKEELIDQNKKFLAPCYNITKKGKIELRKGLFLMSQLEQKRLKKSILSWDLEDRISMIEGFLGCLLIIVLLAMIIFLLENYEIKNNILDGIIGIFGLFFFGFSLLFASSIIFNFIYDFIEKVSSTFVEVIMPYKRFIIAIFYILLAIGGITAFVSFTKYDLSDVIFYGVMAIIGSAAFFIIQKLWGKHKKLK